MVNEKERQEALISELLENEEIAEFFRKLESKMVEIAKGTKGRTREEVSAELEEVRRALRAQGFNDRVFGEESIGDGMRFEKVLDNGVYVKDEYLTTPRGENPFIREYEKKQEKTKSEDKFYDLLWSLSEREKMELLRKIQLAESLLSEYLKIEKGFSYDNPEGNVNQEFKEVFEQALTKVLEEGDIDVEEIFGKVGQIADSTSEQESPEKEQKDKLLSNIAEYFINETYKKHIKEKLEKIKDSQNREANKEANNVGEQGE